MYKDLITYKIAQDITEDKLFTEAQKVFDSWMKNQKGFIKWEITKDKEGNYTDIVYWKSVEDAKKAELDMVNIPNAADWFACYEEGSISSVNLTTVKELG